MQHVNAQYDSEMSMEFYKFTMGGGSDNVHYGIFESPEDDISAAAHNTVLLMAELARRCVLYSLRLITSCAMSDLGA